MQKRTYRSQPSMLEGSIWKGLVAFALPMFFGNLFQQLYNTADTLIVGNFLGKEALAAVSSSASLIFMLVGFLQGLAMGAGVLIAKYYGARDKERLSLAVHTGLAVGITGGLILMTVGVLFTPTFLRWMGTPAEVLPGSISYFRTYFLGSIAVFVYNIAVGILQSVGDSRHPLYYLIISSVLNVLLDLLFVGVFHWGVASAAAATAIAQALAAILPVMQLMRTTEDYRVELRKIRFHGETFRQIVHFGLPAGVQNSVIGFANVVVQKNINFFGADAMAGCGAYAKVEGFVFLPVSCFAMGLATFVGQNLGAKQYDRVRSGARFGVICSMILAEIVGVLVFLLAPYALRLFNDDPNVIAFGTRQAHVESLFFCMLALSHCMAGILRGSGKATVPMVIMLSCWCVFRVLYITVMVGWLQDILVVFTAYPLTWTLSSICFVIYYFKADWIHNFDRLEAKRHAQ